MKINKALFNLATHALSNLEKKSFTGVPDPNQMAMMGAPQPMGGMQGGPPPGGATGGVPGGPPPGAMGDPSMMAPPDPSQAGQADPTAAIAAMLGGAGGLPGGPAAVGQDPNAAPAPDGLPQGGQPDPNGAPPAQPDDIKDKIKAVLAETGVIKAPKIKPEEQFAYITECLKALASTLGVSLPEPPVAQNPGDKKDGASSGSSSGGGSSGGSSKPQQKSAAVDNELASKLRTLLRKK